MRSHALNGSGPLWTRRTWLLTTVPAAASWTFGCRPSGRDASNLGHTREVIQNAGSDTMVNLALAWAEEYADLVPEVSVEVSGGGSGTGIAALINGTVDLANSSRRIEPREIARAIEETGREPRQFIVGYDALAVFVHRDNPLTELTLDQIGDIYREHGAVHRWSDLGVHHPACRRDRIIRVSRQSNSGTYHYFREAVLGKGADFKLGSLDLHGSKDVVELIARTPCAIGYSGMGYGNSHVKALRVARAPGAPPVLPTLETTQDGSYPIARPLYMYTAGEPGPRVRDFMDWVFTDAGQRLVLESGYVPLRPLSQPSP